MLEVFAQTVWGQAVTTCFVSMLPVVELRGGLPYGIALGLDYPLALTAAVLGNQAFPRIFPCTYETRRLEIKGFARL